MRHFFLIASFLIATSYSSLGYDKGTRYALIKKEMNEVKEKVLAQEVVLPPEPEPRSVGAFDICLHDPGDGVACVKEKIAQGNDPLQMNGDSPSDLLMVAFFLEKEAIVDYLLSNIDYSKGLGDYTLLLDILINWDEAKAISQLKYFLSKGLPIFRTARKEYDPVANAIILRKRDFAELLSSQPAYEPNFATKRTARHILACMNDSTEDESIDCLDAMLKVGYRIDVEIEDFNGPILIFSAASRQKKKLLTWLMDIFKKDPNRPKLDANFRFFTFQTCFSKPSSEISKCLQGLQDLGFDISTAKTSFVDLPLYALVEHKKALMLELLKTYSFPRENALLLYITIGQAEEVEKILAEDASILQRSPTYAEDDPTFDFVEEILAGGIDEVVELILSENRYAPFIKPNALTKAIYSLNQTRKFPDLTKILKLRPKEARDLRSEGIFQEIAQGKDDAVLKRKKSELEKLHPRFGVNALHLAVIFQRPKLVKALVDLGLDKGTKDQYGSDAFFMAVNQGKREIVDVLIGEKTGRVEAIQASALVLRQKDLEEILQQSEDELRVLEAVAKKHPGAKEVLFEGVHLNDKVWDEVRASDIDFSGVNFRNCTISADFSEKNVTFASVFDSCNISNTSFIKTYFAAGTAFKNSSIRLTSFARASLKDVHFIKSHLYYVDFVMSDLSGSVFSESYLFGNTFFKATGQSKRLDGTTFWCNLGLKDWQQHKSVACPYPKVGTLTDGRFYAADMDAKEGQIGMNSHELVVQMLIHGVIPVFLDYELKSYDISQDKIGDDVQHLVQEPNVLNRNYDEASIGQAMLMNISQDTPALAHLRNLVGDILQELSGFMLPGGTDIFPLFYGSHVEIENSRDEPRKVTWEDFDDHRFLLEAMVIENLKNAGKPLFGVCRGNQATNVYFGGRMHQHVEGQHTTQTIEISKNSGWVGSIHKGSVIGVSNHHQAVSHPGRGIEFVGGLRNKDHIFIPKLLQGTSKAFPLFLFQFHPENNINEVNEKYMQAYFKGVKAHL